MDACFLIFLDVGLLLLLLLLLLLRRVNRLLPPADGADDADGAGSGSCISAYTGKWSEKRILLVVASYCIFSLLYVQYLLIFNLFE